MEEVDLGLQQNYYTVIIRCDLVQAKHNYYSLVLRLDH